MSTYIDPNRICPDCASKGGLRYETVASSQRVHVGRDGGRHTDHFPPTRDYHCRNCDCEFTLTAWFDMPPAEQPEPDVNGA